MKDLNHIDGESLEFEWTIFPGLTTFGLPRADSRIHGEQQCDPEQFQGRIIFMSIFNDIEWNAKGNKEQCEYKSQTVADYARRFPRGHWSFLVPGSAKKWYGTHSDKPDSVWDTTVEDMMLEIAENHSSTVPCFQ